MDSFSSSSFLPLPCFESITFRAFFQNSGTYARLSCRLVSLRVADIWFIYWVFGLPLVCLPSTITTRAILLVWLSDLHYICPYQRSLASLNMSSVGATCIRHLTISFCFQSWSAQPFDHLNIFVSVVESILIFFLVAGQVSIPYIRMNRMTVLYLLTLLAHFLSRELGSALVQCWPSISRAPLSPAIYPRYLPPFNLLSFLPEIPFMMNPRSFVIIALVLPLFTLSLPTQNDVNAVQR